MVVQGEFAMQGGENQERPGCEQEDGCSEPPAMPAAERGEILTPQRQHEEWKEDAQHRPGDDVTVQANETRLQDDPLDHQQRQGWHQGGQLR